VKHKNEVKRQIAEKQNGASVPARGRKGHVISEEVGARIPPSKTGKPSKKDFSKKYLFSKI
jgi:hypothetical protein